MYIITLLTLLKIAIDIVVCLLIFLTDTFKNIGSASVLTVPLAAGFKAAFGKN